MDLKFTHPFPQVVEGRRFQSSKCLCYFDLRYYYTTPTTVGCVMVVVATEYKHYT